MKRVAITLLFLLIFLVGCGSSIESFKGQIEDVEANRIVVDCSDEANKGKKGAIDSIGYGCTVEYTNQTFFRDESGKSLTVNDFSSGSIVNVILEKSVNIRRSIEKEKPFVLIAKEIVLLTSEEKRTNR